MKEFNIKEKLNLKILEILEDKIKENRYLELNPIYLSKILNILLDSNNLNKSTDLIKSNHLNKIIQYIIKNQEKNGRYKFKNYSRELNPFYFLKIIIKYISNNKKDISKFLKNIIRIIEYTETNFNSIYLLVESRDYENNIYFSAKKNSIILNIIDDLSELLNELNYINLADRLFLIKGKLELGYNRYFYNQKTKSIISKFYPNGEFKVANSLEIIEIINNYKFNQKRLDLKKNKKINEKKFILKLKELKLIENKKFQKEIIKLENYLILFPERIVSKIEFENYMEIFNTLNPNNKYKNYKEINEKIALNLNNLKVIFEIYELLNK